MWAQAKNHNSIKTYIKAFCRRWFSLQNISMGLVATKNLNQISTNKIKFKFQLCEFLPINLIMRHILRNDSIVSCRTYEFSGFVRLICWLRNKLKRQKSILWSFKNFKKFIIMSHWILLYPSPSVIHHSFQQIHFYRIHANKLIYGWMEKNLIFLSVN